ncbi:hypothetical protein PROFUN_10077 [Planoprotostelium fungivorum]|uniref:Uncharacterized protein n=1 Tax=Planoprotostelium fungivorum TaxID=1890364 RepID=A0A2P6NEX9_9EUKA|nr:hypothetical protein PROFUN_10077 [Planoprotostelium fungivorum]
MTALRLIQINPVSSIAVKLEASSRHLAASKSSQALKANIIGHRTETQLLSSRPNDGFIIHIEQCKL